MSVVKGRALPDVADGQKPVQRRILYAMHELGPLRAGAARQVGARRRRRARQVPPARRHRRLRRAGAPGAGLHPALSADRRPGQLRLARRRRRGGDALHRVPADRRSPSCCWPRSTATPSTSSPNYDGAFKEPKLLPARLPMLLLNGASGIGVGMATDIPSHNLGEVARAVVAAIRNPEITRRRADGVHPGPGLSRRRADHLASPRRSAPSTRPAAAACACARAGRSRSSRAASGGSRSPSCRSACRRAPCWRTSSARPIPSRRKARKSLSQEQLNLKSLMLVRARHGARRVGQDARRCASCSSRSRAGRTRRSS